MVVTQSHGQEQDEPSPPNQNSKLTLFYSTIVPYSSQWRRDNSSTDGSYNSRSSLSFVGGVDENSRQSRAQRGLHGMEINITL